MFLCHDKVESIFWPKGKRVTKCFPFATGLRAAQFLLYTQVQRIYALSQTFDDLATTQLSAVLPARKYSSITTSYCSAAFSAALESAALLLGVSQIAVFLCDSRIAREQIPLQLCSCTCPRGHLSPMAATQLLCWAPASSRGRTRCLPRLEEVLQPLSLCWRVALTSASLVPSPDWPRCTLSWSSPSHLDHVCRQGSCGSISPTSGCTSWDHRQDWGPAESRVTSHVASLCCGGI